MRICLIAPKWPKMVNSYPPLGLAYLAAFLERDDHDVRILDLGLDPGIPLDVDIQRVVEFGPDLIGITAMTSNYESALETCSKLKAALAAPIVIGGPHATLFPERVLQEPSFDYAVFGEGEDTLCELARALAFSRFEPTSEDLQLIQGLCYREHGRIVMTSPRPLAHDLDAFPFPARHLFDLERYPLYTPDGQRMMSLLSSRGCPYNCSYCFKGIMGRSYRQRSVDSIMAEIREVVDRYGVRNIYFVDDLFAVDKRRLLEFTQRVIDERLGIRWQCLARVDRIDEESLQQMQRAGCREIHYGIESGNQEMIDRIGKQITLSQVRQAVAWTRGVGILTKGYFMLGLPGDTEETMEQTISFAEELDLDEAMFSLTTPFPGTRLWEDLCAKHPGTEYNADFTHAYYYSSYSEELEPFMNLSDVSDSRLAQLVREANDRFWESKRKHKYVRALGRPWGTWAWQLSRIPAVRAIGRRLLDLGVGPAGKRFRQENAPSWS